MRQASAVIRGSHSPTRHTQDVMDQNLKEESGDTYVHSTNFRSVVDNKNSGSKCAVGSRPGTRVGRDVARKKAAEDAMTGVMTRESRTDVRNGVDVCVRPPAGAAIDGRLERDRRRVPRFRSAAQAQRDTTAAGWNLAEAATRRSFDSAGLRRRRERAVSRSSCRFTIMSARGFRRRLYRVPVDCFVGTPRQGSTLD
ncbi:hypothetical protein HPB47_001445 [Ixodes persulcatus]|uniref:Uncharacterized protein n=1 Tax=Ixodes persulcatus TaxID=34615 RepID=A0AC60PP00_IXOPE|nr:hypothetical protein HPB47_001445 [Ixodes persulcatus]